MSVYVDPIVEYGVSATFRWTKSCHMFSDSIAELHAMAIKIGLKRSWFQEHHADLPHYDLVASKRNLAIKAGAKEVSLEFMVAMMRKNRTALEFKDNFWSKIDKHGPKHPVLKTRCHLWTSTLSTKGYGVVTYKGKQLKAHRVAWKFRTGKWPTPNALHKCDNPPCVRYSHLFEGSKTDNAADRDAKNRQSKGEDRHNAKLTSKKVSKLRKMYASGLYTKEQLAAIFGICGTNVGRIVRKEIWRHV